MTTAMLLTFGMALGTSAVADVPGKERFQLDVRILKGDPLGSRDEGNLKHLAEPRIQVLSNVTASFFAGGHHPYPGPGGTVELMPVGVGLKLKPTLQDNGEIRLDMESQITEVAPGRGVALGKGQFTPAFNVETIFTQKSLKDTQTIRVRIKAASPTDQTWAEITVHLLRPTP